MGRGGGGRWKKEEEEELKAAKRGAKKKHLQLAKEADDLVEQQRGSTQLGRTYYEILLRSENDHSAIRNAKKYFKSSMKLARGQWKTLTREFL
uniref:Uncharacterized protein n=1 Tax=Oryza rufipogon TaxID=4529 RepID=A0A0E0NLU8_ORYRU